MSILYFLIIKSIKEEIKSSSKELDLLREDYLNICQEQTKKSESLKALEGKFNRMKIEFDLLESKSKVSQEDFDKEIITRDILIQNLEKEAVRLTTLNKENLSALNSLEDKIVSSRDECDVLQNNLSILRKKERAGREEVESLSVEVAKLKENFCKQEAEHKEQIAFAEKELEKREGLVSQRESWIISKEASLREMKVELEKFHGKPITSLNI